MQHVDRGGRPGRAGGARRHDVRLPAGRPRAPPARAWDEARVAGGAASPSDEGAAFDREVSFDCRALAPMITFGTNPGMAVADRSRAVPDPTRSADAAGAAGAPAARWTTCRSKRASRCSGTRWTSSSSAAARTGGCPTCATPRLSSAAAAWRPASGCSSCPGSAQVKREAEAEGLDRVFREAGAEWREPGCSMCIAMNGDQLRPGTVCGVDQQPQLRGAPGARRPDAAGQPGHGCRGGGRRRRSPTRGGSREHDAQRITRFEGPAVAIGRDNIDTDQIIPARFLKTTSRCRARCSTCSPTGGPTRTGGRVPDFVLNHAGRRDGARGARGRMELRLRQLARARAVGARRFRVPRGRRRVVRRHLPAERPEERPAAHRSSRRPLHAARSSRTCSRYPGAIVGVDLAGRPSACPAAARRRSAIDAFARECLLAGVDEIGWVLAQAEAIARFRVPPDVVSTLIRPRPCRCENGAWSFMPALEALGWTDRFASAFQAHAAAGRAPRARGARAQHIYRVLTERGEMPRPRGRGAAPRGVDRRRVPGRRRLGRAPSRPGELRSTILAHPAEAQPVLAEGRRRHDARADRRRQHRHGVPHDRPRRGLQPPSDRALPGDRLGERRAAGRPADQGGSLPTEVRAPGCGRSRRWPPARPFTPRAPVRATAWTSSRSTCSPDGPSRCSGPPASGSPRSSTACSASEQQRTAEVSSYNGARPPHDHEPGADPAAGRRARHRHAGPARDPAVGGWRVASGRRSPTSRRCRPAATSATAGTTPSRAARCAAPSADGRCAAERLESYLKLRREADHVAEKQDKLAQLQNKRKWKTISKAIRQPGEGTVTMRDMIFVGIGGYAVALDRATGSEVWRTKLKGSDFVNVAVDGRDRVRDAPEAGSTAWTRRRARSGGRTS